MRALHARERLVDDDEADVSEGIAVGVDLAGCASIDARPSAPREHPIVGYRAKRHTGLIDVERRAALRVADFWEPIARARTEA